MTTKDKPFVIAFPKVEEPTVFVKLPPGYENPHIIPWSGELIVASSTHPPLVVSSDGSIREYSGGLAEGLPPGFPQKRFFENS